jgi:ABC-type multidrug transport system fused ATPase/permease subunit
LYTSGGIIERGGSSIWVIINDIFGQDLFRTLTTLIVVLVAGISTVPQFWWVFVIPIPLHLYFTSHMRQVNSLVVSSIRYSDIFVMKFEQKRVNMFFFVFSVNICSEKLQQGYDKLNRYTDAAGKSLYDGIANVRAVKSFGKEEEETSTKSSLFVKFSLRFYK